METVAAILTFALITLFLTTTILWTKAKWSHRRPCLLTINNEKGGCEGTEGQTLLTALSSQNIFIPSPCGGKATCHQCRLKVLEGRSQPFETEKAAFTKKELDEGWRLSCQTRLASDVRLIIPEDYLAAKKIEGRVVSNEACSTFIKELVVALENEVPYHPGQFMQMVIPPYKMATASLKDHLDPRFHKQWEEWGLFDCFIENEDEQKRAYSMASYPAEKNLLKFDIRIATAPFENSKVSKKIPWGIGSSYLFSLQAGDRIDLLGPFGEARHNEIQERELIFLIGGVGSSFARSHLLHLLRTQRSQQKISLWYGARAGCDRIYHNEWRQLEKEFPQFRYHLVLSAPTEEDKNAHWPLTDPLQTGYVYQAFELGQLKNMEEPENALYFVCGPPLHNVAIMKLLDDYGIPRDNIVLDDFGN